MLDIQQEELKLSLLLQRYRPTSLTQTQKALNEALDNIQLELIKTEDLTDRARLRHIEKTIFDELNNSYKAMPQSLQNDIETISETSYNATSRALATHGAVLINYPDLPKRAINAMIDMNEINLIGDKAYRISDFVTIQKDTHIKRFNQIVAGGIAEGADTSTVAKRLREINSGLMFNNLEAIAKTTMSIARSRGQEEAYKVASDVIIGWEYNATLDSRTTKLCASLDSKIYYKSSGYTIEKLHQINRVPPIHFFCRSVLIPRTKHSSQLDKDRTRASNGDEKKQVSAKTSFKEFFNNQSADFKRDYLGDTKYNLYKANKLQIKDFVDVKSGREFTIEEIKKHLH